MVSWDGEIFRGRGCGSQDPRLWGDSQETPLSCLAQGQVMAMVWELEAEGERAVGLEYGGTYDVWRIVEKECHFQDSNAG